jgi:hypothetical protein
MEAKDTGIPWKPEYHGEETLTSKTNDVAEEEDELQLV